MVSRVGIMQRDKTRLPVKFVIQHTARPYKVSYMKPIHYILTCCLLGLVSCGDMDSLSQFSKRKYLKKAPKQKAVEQVIQPKLEAYAGIEMTPEAFVLREIPEIDDKGMKLLEEPISSKTDVIKAYPIAYKEFKPVPEDTDESNGGDRKPNWLGLAGFSSSLLGIIIPMALYTSARTFSFVYLGISAVLILAGLILTSIAISQIRKKPQGYNLTGLAWSGFFISLAVLTFLISLSVLAIILSQPVD